MTKKTFTLLLSIFFAATCFAQQVEEVQRTLLTKRTATWCPICGNYGWTMMDYLLTDNADKATIIAAHENGSSLGTQTGEDITANWGAFGQPTFFVNEVNQNVGSSNVDAKRTDIKAQVDAAYDSAPVANVGFAPVYQNGEIKVDAKVKFFQAAQGEFFLSIYLLEDGVEADQAGSVADDIHDRVLRFNFSNSSWGEPLTSGSVSAGQEFSQSFALPIGDPTGYDYHVAGIIWRLDGGVYIPVNTWSTTTIQMATSVEEVAELTGFEVRPTVTSNSAVIQLELSDNQQVAKLDLFNLNGQKVSTLFEGELSAGTHPFEVNKEMTGGNGTFIVRFSNGEQVSSQRVIFQ